MKNRLFLFCLLLFACTEKRPLPDQEIKVYIDSDTKIDFNQKISDVQLIPLESDSKDRMGSCSKIRIYKDRIYIYSLSDFSIFIHSTDGSFIKALNPGSRPKIQPSGLFIHKEKEELWTINEFSILMRYDLNGNFLAKEELPFRAADLTGIDDEIFYFHAGFDRNIDYHMTRRKIDKKEELFHMLPYEKENDRRTYIPLSLFAETVNNDRAYMLLSDKIYVADAMNQYHFTPLYKLDFGEDLLLEKLFNTRKMTDKENAELLTSNQYINGIRSFYQASGCLFMRFSGKYHHYSAIDLNTDEVFSFDYLFDHINPNYTEGSTILGGAGDQLYCIFKNTHLQNYYKDHATLYEGVRGKLDRITDDPSGWTVAIISLK